MNDTRQKPVTCVECGKTFSNNANLKIHHRIHTGEKPFVCNACHQSFSDQSHLRRHIRIHTGEKPFVCIECGKRFSQNFTLKSHLRVHTGEKLFVCDICNKNFSRNSDLKIHLRVHTGNKPYRCSFCSKCFTDSSHLKRHLRRHTGEKPYSCDWCSKMFATRIGHKLHTQRAHSDNGSGVIAAPVPPKQVSSHLKRHLRKHAGEKPYACDWCSKVFATRNGLKRHAQRTHSDNGSGVIAAPVAPKQVSSLRKRHLQMHTGEKSYACDWCSKIFATRNGLKRHAQRTHSDKGSGVIAAPVAQNCSDAICLLQSAPKQDRSHLKRHLRKHTGEKLYACDWCSKIFLTPIGLKRHTQRTHSNNGSGVIAAPVSPKCSDSTCLLQSASKQENGEYSAPCSNRVGIPPDSKKSDVITAPISPNCSDVIFLLQTAPEHENGENSAPRCSSSPNSDPRLFPPDAENSDVIAAPNAPNCSDAMCLLQTAPEHENREDSAQRCSNSPKSDHRLFPPDSKNSEVIAAPIAPNCSEAIFLLQTAREHENREDSAPRCSSSPKLGPPLSPSDAENSDVIASPNAPNCSAAICLIQIAPEHENREDSAPRCSNSPKSDHRLFPPD